MKQKMQGTHMTVSTTGVAFVVQDSHSQNILTNKQK